MISEADMDCINDISIDQDILRDLKKHILYPIFCKLMEGVYHSTTIDGFKGIYKDKKINPNIGNKYPVNHCQTKTNYGYKKKYISLLDLELARIGRCIENFSEWNYYFSTFTTKIILKLERASLTKLIGNPYIKDVAKIGEFNKVGGFVPYFEVWYPKSIPTSAVTGCFISNKGETPVFYDNLQEVREVINKLEVKA